jgi:hypothetical protein
LAGLSVVGWDLDLVVARPSLKTKHLNSKEIEEEWLYFFFIPML